MHLFPVLLLLLFAASTRAEPPRPATAAAAEIREATQAPARLVWRQDMDDGIDAGAGKTRCRLMGLDTEDGRGERAILPDLSNYSRPLLTPRGDRVIFSNQRENKIYIVNWDGSGLRCLGNGYAVAAWQDPAAAGVEWIYGGAWATNSDALASIQRAPIDQPGRIETVWSRTPVNPDNFQLSTDGRLACGNLPWPVCGTVELPDRDWKKYGDGCWPSLAPENAGRFWIFDGAHRNLTLFRIDTGEHWVVNISHAPGIGGYEVYHPRWSNRARFMVMTGPYKLGEGDNRIRGGGPDVEVYLGRFDESYRSVERWVRVTYNEHADLYPDIWIAPQETPGKPTLVSTAAAPAVIKSTAWPENKEGLVFLWENSSQKNELPTTGNFARICRIDARNMAHYNRYFEMDVSRGYFTADPDLAQKLLAACRNSGQFTLEAVLTPRNTEQPASARIVSFAGSNSVNFALVQDRGRLLFQLNDSAKGKLFPAISTGSLAFNAPQHIVISYQSGQLSCFWNGNPAAGMNAPKDALRAWAPGELAFGDRTNFWPGLLDHVAFYHRALGEAEAMQNYRLLVGDLSSRKPAARLEITARLVELTAIPTPASIIPYRRALASNRYQVIKVIRGQCNAKQIMAAHWVIGDGKVLESAQRQKDKIYRLVLEPLDEHPELVNERVTMDSDEFLLPLYYEVE